VPTGATTYDRIEIARFITPYDITGGGGPGTCPWEYDLTPYQPLLHDSVTLALSISTDIGGNRGWLITADFELVEGQPDPEPYRVQRLWDIGNLAYGDPDSPPESHIQPAQVFTDETTQAVLARVVCTGHGQGNTDNAAEFSNKWHRLWIIGDMYQHQLWRNDCGSNPCRPQGGTWQYNRAGWCPGASVPPWDIMYTNFAPGDIVEFYYEIQPYTNQCRPTNPDCISGVTCGDCAYNSTNHTPPRYILAANAILYRAPTSAAPPESPPLPQEIALYQNYPNPFNASTEIRYDLPQAAKVQLKVFDILGHEVVTLIDGMRLSGAHCVIWDSKTASGVQGASGVYVYQIKAGSFVESKKMLLIR
jgi:hypothetical protein